MAVRKNNAGSRQRHGRQNLVGLLCLSFAVVFAALLIARGQNSKTNERVKELAPQIVSQFDTIQIPVPIKQVATGTLGRDIPLTMISYPKHQVPEGALASMQSVLEAVTTVSLPAKLPMFSDNFSHVAHRSNPVIERIPKGMRAITLRVDVTAAVEGWAGSGAHVDVLLVESERTTVVAENVNILSAERSVAPVAGASAPDVPSTVTILASQEQVLAINTAIPRGKIAFALRSLGDQEVWRDRVYTAERLQTNKKSIPVKDAITGYATVKFGSDKRAFALADGKWISTNVVPKGYLVAEQEPRARIRDSIILKPKIKNSQTQIVDEEN
jgi:Flp pilus assembly protein CpaB